MSLRDPQKYLYDMLSSCEFLLEFTKGKSIKDYRDDRAFRSALERELQIIGEAMMQLEKICPERAEQIDEHFNIIAFRHIIVHGYDSLDPATVWNVVETKLDKLRGQIESLLKSY